MTFAPAICFIKEVSYLDESLKGLKRYASYNTISWQPISRKIQWLTTAQRRAVAVTYVKLENLNSSEDSCSSTKLLMVVHLI